MMIFKKIGHITLHFLTKGRFKRFKIFPDIGNGTRNVLLHIIRFYRMFLSAGFNRRNVAGSLSGGIRRERDVFGFRDRVIGSINIEVIRIGGQDLKVRSSVVGYGGMYGCFIRQGHIAGSARNVEPTCSS